MHPGGVACSAVAVGVETYELPLGDYMWVAAVPAGAAAGREDSSSVAGAGRWAAQCQLERCYAVGAVVERKTIQVRIGGRRCWELAAGWW